MLLSVVVFVVLVVAEQESTRAEHFNKVLERFRTTVEQLHTTVKQFRTVVEELQTVVEGFNRVLEQFNPAVGRFNEVVERFSSVPEEYIMRSILFSMRPVVFGRPSDQLPRAVCPESPVRFPRMLADNKLDCFPVSTGFVVGSTKHTKAAREWNRREPRERRDITSSLCVSCVLCG